MSTQYTCPKCGSANCVHDAQGYVQCLDCDFIAEPDEFMDWPTDQGQQEKDAQCPSPS